MKPVTDEMLMAYADGELDAPARAELERAIAADAALAGRLQAQMALRARLQAAFAPELDEPVPERLRQAARPPTPGTVVDLAAQRAARRTAPPADAWWRWGGLAASVLLGVLIGRLWPAAGPAGEFAEQDGRLVARGAVAQALSTQRAAAPAAAAAVAVQLSFVDQAGAYCRTFSTASVAGLACRSGDDWNVQLLAEAEPASAGTLRQAASALPPAVLGAVDQRMAGRPLDAQAEQAALQRGWRR